MSQILYEADNLSIKGHHYVVKTYSDLHSTSDGTNSDAIHLDFTLLINGKLKTFGWSFIIEKDNENGFEYSLAQWSDWNAIHTILNKLGYIIDDSVFGQGLVREWIGKIMN